MTAPMSEPTVSEERVEELARHFHAGVPGIECSHSELHKPCEHEARVLLGSPWMRDLLAEVWDEGQQAFASALLRPLGANGMRDVEPNPYRTEQR